MRSSQEFTLAAIRREMDSQRASNSKIADNQLKHTSQRGLTLVHLYIETDDDPDPHSENNEFPQSGGGSFTLLTCRAPVEVVMEINDSQLSTVMSQGGGGQDLGEPVEVDVEEISVQKRLSYEEEDIKENGRKEDEGWIESRKKRKKDNVYRKRLAVAMRASTRNPRGVLQ
ncbi:hypothetical protein U9M48_017233 [Paspalum notatum var. saurae]|uniref:Uncharacterized protein n=1 Tax=Paspalum notatum var. saurae TaxID=547442 RepID=A0AAQ3TAI6_PASNO